MRVVAEEIAFDQDRRYIGRDVIAHAGFAQQRMSEGLVKATSSGVVVQLPIKAGDQVAAGTMLAQMAQLDLMVVQVEVGARVVNALHLKQRVVVTLPTVPPQDVEGVVTTIGPIPTANRLAAARTLSPLLKGFIFLYSPATGPSAC